MKRKSKEPAADSAQPSTLGRCGDCSRGWYKWDEDMQVFLCNNCGKEPSSGVAGMAKQTDTPDPIEDGDEGLAPFPEDKAKSKLREQVEAAEGANVASTQGTLEVVQPTEHELRIGRAILMCRDAAKKIAAFKKKAMANLEVQMKADKHDFIMIDGVTFSRVPAVDVKIVAFDDWTPHEDTTEALIKMLGISAEDLGGEAEVKPTEDSDSQAEMALG